MRVDVTSPRQLENKSITSKAMQYGQDKVTRMLITWVELITISIITIRSVRHNSAAVFGVLENFRRKFAILLPPPTDVSMKSLVHCKEDLALWQTSETVSKSIHNWRRYPSSNWYKIDYKCGSKFGALLWRHLTPQRKHTSMFLVLKYWVGFFFNFSAIYTKWCAHILLPIFEL